MNCHDCKHMQNHEDHHELYLCNYDKENLIEMNATDIDFVSGQCTHFLPVEPEVA